MKNDYILRKEVMSLLTEEYKRRRTDEGLKLAWIELAVNRTPGIGWVSAREELPMPNQYVLVATKTKKGDVNIVRGYSDGERWCCGMNSNVTHWMPMPAPPEEED